MDTPLSRQLQQAWLLSQINKQSSLPPDLPSLHGSSAFSVPSPDPSMFALPFGELVSDSVPFPSNIPSSYDDMLLDPVLDYINDMLMDEEMEDRKCMRQECIAYQAIINNFYEILDEKPSLPCSVPELSPSSGGSEVWDEPLPSFEVRDDYSWIDEVLVEDPSISQQGLAVTVSSPWLPDSTSTSSSEQDVKLCSFDSSSGSSPYSQDSAVYSPGLRESSVSASQSYGSAMHDFGIPGSQNLLLPDPILPGVDLRAGNTSKSEGPWQSVPRDEAVDSKFRRVVSEDLQYSTNFANENENGGFRRAISEKILDRQRQSQEARRSVHGNDSSDSSYHPVNGENNSQSQEFETKVEGRDVIGSDEKGGEVSSFKSDELSFVKNEYLKAEKTAKIYGEWSPGKGGTCDGKKKEGQSNGASVKRSGTPEAVDLRAMLVSCAQAVAGNDMRTANGLLQEVRQHASPHGTASQRLAHYFSEGLIARLAGTGTRLYTVMSNNRPSAAKMLKAYRLTVEVCPYVKLSHYFANHNILKVAEGASRLHIVDYGILYGFQWPSLISALAERKGGPPFLRITGIDFPHPGLNHAERVTDTGRRLAEYARAYNVPFEYTPIASKWEDVEPASLHRKQGEVLVVNSILRLRNLLDESVVSSSPRQKVLNRMRSMNPDILVVAVTNAGFNAPFFVSRFREALYHYSSKFDMLDTTIDSDNTLRLMFERELLGRDILNIVACEGPERVERPETYRQWQARIQRAGFELQRLNPVVVSKSRAVVKSCYHKDFGVDDDSKWMLLGWKGRIVEAISAWKVAGTTK